MTAVYLFMNIRVVKEDTVVNKDTIVTIGYST